MTFYFHLLIFASLMVVKSAEEIGGYLLELSMQLMMSSSSEWKK